ncbi:unnamed protein product [Caenorhabditis angaria]|uniref:F-box domain-containing protein n=1 Tax=Caenorhabditis angaria TaxID=860376 RepID=A0A9P1J4Z0_9PELO|nr:unnamed protein product [Caenorhabditis angaria]
MVVTTRGRKSRVQKYLKTLCFASRFIGKAEKTRFKNMKNFKKLPIDIRKIIVDKMTVNERCRFAKCSKPCNKLAQLSKNFMYGLKFISQAPFKFTIQVNHNKPKIPSDFDKIIEIERKNGKKLITFRAMWKKPYSRELPGPLYTIFEDACKFFENLVNENRHSLKTLELTGTSLKNATFNFQKTPLLRELYMDRLLPDVVKSSCNTQLKLFQCKGRYTDEPEQCFGKLAELDTVLNTPSVCFTLEQAKRLEANRGVMSIKNWTAQDLFDFIRFWQNGHDQEVRAFHFYSRTNVDVFDQELLKLLNVEFDDPFDELIRVYDKSAEGKSAKLVFMENAIFFGYPFEAYHRDLKVVPKDSPFEADAFWNGLALDHICRQNWSIYFDK